MTDGDSPFDEGFVKEASAAVLHYFKKEQNRDSVTVAEFAEALEKVLKGFEFEPASHTTPKGNAVRIEEADLQQLATESGGAFELNFFPKLRDAMRLRLQQSPQVLRFRGLRKCVKQLTGARRWTARCESLQDQILGFLRECLHVEPHPDKCSLVVE